MHRQHMYRADTSRRLIVLPALYQGMEHTPAAYRDAPAAYRDGPQIRPLHYPEIPFSFLACCPWIRSVSRCS